MNNLRTYGNAPFTVAVVHGGPGAPGEMAPVARELACEWGVLEPLQTATSLEGQTRELRIVLETHGMLPITLVGFSWGAWLCFLVAAYYPNMVNKLILIGSGPFEAHYAEHIQTTRLQRLSVQERAELIALMSMFQQAQTRDATVAFERFGALCAKADAYDPLPYPSEIIACQVEMFQGVWEEAAEMRRSGKLLEVGQQITCPVVAIHGDYDPHPIEGVQRPLSATLKNFRLMQLNNCGHKPWIERQARDTFFKLLKAELKGEFDAI